MAVMPFAQQDTGPTEPDVVVPLEEEAPEVAERFISALVARELLQACGDVTPNQGWLNPCLDDLRLQAERIDQLQREVSPNVRVTAGAAPSSGQMQFSTDHFHPRPVTTLTLTVERDRNGDWKVTSLDERTIPHG